MKDKHTQMPRGFGFVTFSDPSVIDKVLEDEHIIDGRTVRLLSLFSCLASSNLACFRKPVICNLSIRFKKVTESLEFFVVFQFRLKLRGQFPEKTSQQKEALRQERSLSVGYPHHLRKVIAALTRPPVKQSLYVKLKLNISDELKEHFEAYGKVVEHMIMLDHGTGRSRGFGFVTFESEEAVEKVISEGRMHSLGGKQVRLLDVL